MVRLQATTGVIIMSKITIVGNDGVSYRINDINCITNSGRHYFVDGQSDQFNCNTIWQKVKNYSVPTQPFVANGTNEEREAMNEQYYWLFGDAFHGGMAFSFYSSTSMYRLLYDIGHEEISSSLIPNSGWFYLYCNEFLDGIETDEYMYIIESWQDGGKLSGQTLVIHPTVPPTWTLGFIDTPFNSIDGFGVQATWDYVLYDAPTGACRNNTSSDGLNFDIEGLSIGVVKSPFIFGGSRVAKIQWWDLIEKREDDPNDNAPESNEGGGNGDDQESVDIDFPSLPPDMLINSGVLTFFNPNASDLQSMIDYIYSRPDQIITNFKKIWANPMESIISLAIVPFTVEQDVSKELRFCGVSTGLSFPTLKSQYAKINCGTLPLPEEYASFLDYGDFTHIKCWLPFIGIVDLSADDCIGGTLEIEYNCDLFTGDCVAYIKSTKTVPHTKIKYNSVIYAFNGNMLSQAPLTGNNYQGLYGSILNLATSVALPVISPTKTAMTTLMSVKSAMGSVGSELMGQKVNVQRSGVVSGNSGTLGEYRPYVIIERPIRNRPANNGIYNAYPINKTYKLNDIKGSGFTVVRDGTCRISNTKITKEERNMIKEIFESGVIV